MSFFSRQKEVPREPEKIAVSSIPTAPLAPLPVFEVVAEAAKTGVSEDWQKKYYGFDINHSAVWSNISRGYEKVKRMEFENQADVIENFKQVDCVFDDDYCDRRMSIFQDPVLVEQQCSKSIEGGFLQRAMGAHSNTKTEITTSSGGGQVVGKKGGLLSFLFR